MEYYDIDYEIKIDNKIELSEEDNIVDIILKNYDHYCESSDTYWENVQDEALYLRIKDSEGIDKVVCVAKNFVKESEIYFDNSEDKEKFYEVKHSDDFYNHLEIYLTLSDKQAVQLLNVMSDNIDDYDYNFQYCNSDVIIKNIIKPNLDNQEVENSYSKYLQKLYNKDNIELMLDDSNDNIIKFPSGKK